MSPMRFRKPFTVGYCLVHTEKFIMEHGNFSPVELVPTSFFVSKQREVIDNARVEFFIIEDIFFLA